MKIKYSLLPILLLLNLINIKGQTIPTESLFEFYQGDFQRNIRISERIKKEWNLEHNFLQHVHYNANTDARINSVNLIKHVAYIYYKKDNNFTEILELIDDGKHYDSDFDDKIYGNYMVINDFNNIETDYISIEVELLNSTGIVYTIAQFSVNYLPEIPKIIAPQSESVISSDQPEIFWEIDPNADGCGLILLGSTPILGEELKDIIWQMELRENTSKVFNKKIPIKLLDNKRYTLIIWTYTNTKQINNKWNQAAYSIEWNTFHINTSYKNKELILSQNFPNPFNSNTYIKYNLPNDGNVTINIFDIIGREVITLINQEQLQGEHYIFWDGKDYSGNDVASGVYFYNIRFNNQLKSQKMLLAR